MSTEFENGNPAQELMDFVSLPKKDRVAFWTDLLEAAAREMPLEYWIQAAEEPAK